MPNKIISDARLTAIADAIRTKGGTADTLTVTQMPQAIAALPDETAAEPYVEYTVNDNNEITGAALHGLLNVPNRLLENTQATDITFPDNAIGIGERSFAYCPLHEIVLPDTIQTIDEMAFMACPNLVMIHLPASLVQLEQQVFMSCAKLTNTIDIPIGVTTLKTRVFYGTAIKSVNAPGVTTVASTGTSTGQFATCTSLASATIGSVGHAVSYMNPSAFKSCNALTALTIYTADGQPLADSPFGAVNATVTYLQA